MTIDKLGKILATLAHAGMGGSPISAEHDQIYLYPPDDGILPDDEVGKKLIDAGADYDESNGWYIFV